MLNADLLNRYKLRRLPNECPSGYRLWKCNMVYWAVVIVVAVFFYIVRGL
jgi:hypothetical protein